MFGYRQGQNDHMLFVKHFNHGHITILIVYVDDIIVTGDDCHEMTNIKLMLAKEFEVKDLGPLRYFLGMEIARNRKGISVSQRKYTLDLLAETCMLGCEPSCTPLEQAQNRHYLKANQWMWANTKDLSGNSSTSHTHVPTLPLQLAWSVNICILLAKDISMPFTKYCCT
ncbi:Cysteine-rich RLK (receptor-like protein kinase) 8 [Dorcoceras hygrometricum]|uniref:Cysteine-rich RLK (Receptor-like protein kinase) 8 n=1 Tax=Dorcoceras hygrometricum TaxID=472368 RepID=A0A2Z7AJ86_9LAMI|nr:Cysteine-rich RLK (receptor-like protein kinase) 8 [Dorcoceras hygrometricum]